MNFYVNSQGQIIRVDPEDVFQGSVNANTINFVGAFPSTCPVTVAFRLPTGEWTTPASMGMHADLTLPGVQQPDGTQFNIWQYTIPGTVTENYGTVNLQFYVYAQGSNGTGNMIATASSSFDVKKGVPVVLPDPSDDYEKLLTNILSALQQLQQADSEGALAAQESATAAANSASAAANSATAASNSATIAQTNAQSAQTNAQAAVSAANRAEDSETAAQAAQSAAESAQAAAEAARDEAEALLEGKIDNLSVETLNIGDVELTGTSDGILWSDIAVGEEMNGETLHFNTSTDIPYEDFPSASDEILITFENGYKLAVRSQAQGAEIAMLDAGGSVAGPVIYMADGGWMDDLYDFSNAEADSLIVQSMETEETAVSEAAKKFISAVIKTDITLNVDGNISVGNNAIYASKNPTNANELTRKAYVDSKDTNLQNNKYDKTGGTISGDVVVTGDLTVQGTTTTNDTETLVVKDNLIVTNSDGATLAGLSGLIIRVNSAQSYGIVYDPANEGTVKLGLGTYNAETGVFTFATGEGLPVAVRALSTAWTNLHLAAWDAASNQFVDAGKAVADFQEKLTFDTTPTQNSTNPVTSGGVYSALQGKQNTLTAGDGISIDDGVISANLQWATDTEIEALFVTSFATANWAAIAKISEDGLAENYFSVGDEKTIELTTGEQVTLVILGFNHDDLTSGGKAGITIGMKNLLATTYRMNATATNEGGWDESEMRTSTMATLLSQLPSDLQSVIKQVNKKATAGNQSEIITTSADKLWLFAEVEIDGTTTAGYADEGEQYEYWKTVKDGTVADDRKKYLSNGSGSAKGWWLRSPSVSSNYIFRCIYSSGSVTGISANNAYGVCFGFCI